MMMLTSGWPVGAADAGEVGTFPDLAADALESFIISEILVFIQHRPWAQEW